MLRKVMNYFLIVLMFVCCAVVKADTLAYWQFDDNEPGSTTTLGERIVDSSGNGRDLHAGTGTDTPTFKTSNYLYGVGSAIAMDSGSDELIFTPNYNFGDGDANAGDALDFATEESCTLEAMVRIPASTDSGAICAILQQYASVGTYPNMYFRFESSTSIRFSISDATNIGIIFTATGLPNCYDGNWHHVAAVRDADNLELRIYLDYTLVGTVTDPTNGGFIDSASTWYVGAMGAMSSREFIGSIDFIRISNAALATTEFVQPGAYVASEPSPADRAYDVAIPSVTLSWIPASGTGVTVSSQVVEVAADSNFDNLVQTFNLSGTETSAALTPIVNNRRYYWRVNTTGTDNGVSFTEEGASWNFHTMDSNTTVLGYWKFDNGTPGATIDANSKILDYSGNERHLVPLSVSSSAVTNYGNPCAAYGSGASLSNNKGMLMRLIPGNIFADSSVAGSTPVLASSNGDITIEAVVKTNSGSTSGSNGIFSCMPAMDTDSWYGTGGTDEFYFRINDTTGYARFGVINDGNSSTAIGVTNVYDGWHHVAAVRDTAAAKIRIYIDGALDAEVNDVTVPLGDIFPDGRSAVGGFANYSSTSRNFNGSIDFVKVTRAALDTTEFVQAFAIPTNPDPADGATAVETTYTFSWTAITGATITSQTVQIATDPYMQNIVQTITASGNSAAVSGLNKMATYYWRVNTVGSDGDGSFSREGEIWSFSTPNCLLVATDGDFNGDCIVDFKDFAILANNWCVSSLE